ncbi:MAG: hypothetical protein LBU11_12685 [Zoogloeaceae bacterium]|jgi:hypothetical protein|nr:hypothetical protein [Zoogloeaceae bacterium]
MKLLTLGLLTPLTLLMSVGAIAASITLKSDQPLCENAPPLGKAALVQAKRDNRVVKLDVVTEFNCAYIPGKPELRVRQNAVSVILPTQSPSGEATACLCQHKLTFEIVDLHKDAKTIYYMQDGTVLGHTDVP